ncbi:putative zinc-binding metallopeptidase [Sphingomonas naphthae]|uniref:Zinc-binding metallopeptidase n=1 Tax=Sphingomonas naphthae TaxID=1813468 RepID=A0ABY7THB2_9SPHN|nr:putative zinc-binding metallopeptidase [Sphingomonas naphthae]WCT72603.1 putative zinc-binding metallopeptidase [Sphingomonas naphthae]
MRPYECPNCSRPTHFEVRVCPNCEFTLGYDPASDQLLFLGDNATTWRDAQNEQHAVVVCQNNNEYQICNWLVPAVGDQPLCLACKHNRTIPDLTAPSVPERWAKIEAAKRRMLHTVLHLNLPCETVAEAEANGTQPGLAFDFLYDPVGEETGTVQITTGHEAGLITLNLIEADDVQREKMRTSLGEPYRTLLGHFRHEVGHYYWSRLIENTPEVEGFRAVFGDERISYEEAMGKHYGGGEGGGWTSDFVSAYATMHPWEDFAETFAHLLHIMDTLATIQGFGMRMTEWPGSEDQPAVDFDPYHAETTQLVSEWGPFAFAANAINRAMGQPDLYPFRLTDPVVRKLDYVNRLVQRACRVDIVQEDRCWPQHDLPGGGRETDAAQNAGQFGWTCVTPPSCRESRSLMRAASSTCRNGLGSFVTSAGMSSAALA